jgi:hypothetical protein
MHAAATVGDGEGGSGAGVGDAVGGAAVAEGMAEALGAAEEGAADAGAAEDGAADDGAAEDGIEDVATARLDVGAATEAGAGLAPPDVHAPRTTTAPSVSATSRVNPANASPLPD